MELFIFVGTLCVLAVLAMRYGYDSRETVDSKEQELAKLGITAGDQT